MSKVNNADMPSMPLTGDAYTDISGYKDIPGGIQDGMGLSKLEHFAGLAIPPMEMIIEAMTEHSSPFTLDDYIVCAVSYKVKEAKALLAQLDQEKGDE